MWAANLGDAAMIETSNISVKCPRCGTWPMAAILPKPTNLLQHIRFTCPKCRHQEEGRLSRTAQQGFDAA